MFLLAFRFVDFVLDVLQRLQTSLKHLRQEFMMHRQGNPRSSRFAIKSVSSGIILVTEDLLHWCDSRQSDVVPRAACSFHDRSYGTAENHSGCLFHSNHNTDNRSD